MVKDIFIPFATGITIFLFGLQLMRIGLEKFAGDHLKTWLLRFTETPVRSFLTGIFSTALLQSSSAVTVLTISFVDLGILSFIQSIGIILGTNIGTTITTEILALNIEDFALPLVFLGALLYFLPWKRLSLIGLILGGFGCIFLGMETMKWLAQPLKERGIIDWLMSIGEHPILMGLLAGAILTALIQSSSATIAIAMGFYSSGVISLPFAIAVVLGSNIGTCVTGLLATFGTKTAAKQVAVAHLILNVVGVIWFAPFISLISDFAPVLSSQPAQQLAHIQTLFNLICSLVVLPFAVQFAKGVMWLVPSHPSQPSYLTVRSKQDD